MIEITVDELVLRGLSPEDAQTVMAAFEARLAAFARGGADELPVRAESFRRLPEVAVPAGSPRALGDAVADAVWSAVGGGAR